MVIKAARKLLSISLVSSLILTAPGLEPYRAFALSGASKPAAKPVVVQVPMIPAAGVQTNWTLIQLHLQRLGVAQPLSPAPKDIPAGKVNASLIEDLKAMAGLSQKTAAELKDSSDSKAKKESDEIFGLHPRTAERQVDAVVASLKDTPTRPMRDKRKAARELSTNPDPVLAGIEGLRKHLDDLTFRERVYFFRMNAWFSLHRRLAEAPKDSAFDPEKAAEEFKSHAKEFLSEAAPKIESAQVREAVVSVVEDHVRGIKNLAARHKDERSFAESLRSFHAHTGEIIYKAARELSFDKAARLIREQADKTGENPGSSDSRRGFASAELAFVIAAASIAGVIGGLVSGIAAAALTAAMLSRESPESSAPKLSPNSVKILRHPDEILSHSLSPSGAKIATVGKDMTVRIWERESGKLLHSLPYRWTKESNPRLLFSPDESKILAAHDSDYTVDLWEIGPEKHLGQLKYEGLKFASFSRDGSQVVTAGSKAIRVFETGSLKLLSEFEIDYFGKALLTPDGSMLITTEPNFLYEERSRVRVYSLKDGKLLGDFPKAQRISLSADGRTAVVAENRSAFIWDLKEQKILHKLKTEAEPVSWFRPLFTKNREPWIYSALMASDGRKAILSLADGKALVFDAKEGKLLHSLKGSKGDLFSASLNYNGSAAVTVGQDGVVKFWNAESGRLMSKLQGHGSWASHSLFNSDGTKAVTFAGDYLHDTTAILWDAEKGSPLLIARGYLDVPDTIPSAHKNQSWVSFPKWGGGKTSIIGSNIRHNYASFSPEGDSLLVQGDKTLRVWELAPERSNLPTVKNPAARTEPKEDHRGESGFIRLEALPAFLAAALAPALVLGLGYAVSLAAGMNPAKALIVSGAASLLPGLAAFLATHHMDMKMMGVEFIPKKDAPIGAAFSKALLASGVLSIAGGLLYLLGLGFKAATASAAAGTTVFLAGIVPITGTPGTNKSPMERKRIETLRDAFDSFLSDAQEKTAGILQPSPGDILRSYQDAARAFKKRGLRRIKPAELRPAVGSVVDAAVQSIFFLARARKSQALGQWDEQAAERIAEIIESGRSVREIVKRVRMFAKEIKKNPEPPLDSGLETELLSAQVDLFVTTWWKLNDSHYRDMAKTLKSSRRKFNQYLVGGPKMLREAILSIVTDHSRAFVNLTAVRTSRSGYTPELHEYRGRVADILKRKDVSLKEKMAAVKMLADETEPEAGK